MSDSNHATFLEWLYTEQDVGLPPNERRRLDAHLATCESCRQERESIAKMDELLGASRIPVDEGFTARVGKKAIQWGGTGV